MARVELWILFTAVILAQTSVSDGAGQKPQPKTDSECNKDYHKLWCCTYMLAVKYKSWMYRPHQTRVYTKADNTATS